MAPQASSSSGVMLHRLDPLHALQVPQGVPAAGYRQRAWPSHTPPHLPLGSLALSMHSPSGSLPAGVGTHVPIDPARLQLPHLSQLMLQQTPSLHVPDRHWALRLQARLRSNAIGHCVAVPPPSPLPPPSAGSRQYRLSAQSGSVLQSVLHWAVPAPSVKQPNPLHGFDTA